MKRIMTVAGCCLATLLSGCYVAPAPQPAPVAYYQQPRPVYVAPRPVYVPPPRPVYVIPPPRPYYPPPPHHYHPPPPGVSIGVNINN